MPARPKTWKPFPLGPAGRPRDHRPSAALRGYDRHWQRIRASVLAEAPLCLDCESRGLTVAAEEVDHVLPLARGGTHDRRNLRPLCKPCHSRKTNREDGGLGRTPTSNQR